MRLHIISNINFRLEDYITRVKNKCLFPLNTFGILNFYLEDYILVILTLFKKLHICYLNSCLEDYKLIILTLVEKITHR